MGDVFTTGDGRKLRIVDMLPVPETEAGDLRLGGVWVVEAVGQQRRSGG